MGLDGWVRLDPTPPRGGSSPGPLGSGENFYGSFFFWVKIILTPIFWVPRDPYLGGGGHPRPPLRGSRPDPLRVFKRSLTGTLSGRGRKLSGSPVRPNFLCVCPVSAPLPSFSGSRGSLRPNLSYVLPANAPLGICQRVRPTFPTQVNFHMNPKKCPINASNQHSAYLVGGMLIWSPPRQG